MGVLAAIDLAFKIFDKLNVGTDKVITFYNNVIRPANPDAPELTDQEIIAKMKQGFTDEREIAEAALGTVRSGKAPASDAQLRVTTAADLPQGDKLGSPMPGTPAPYDPTGGGPTVEPGQAPAAGTPTKTAQQFRDEKYKK